MFASHARQLQNHLVALAMRVREIRGLMLVDRNGLTLVSTLSARTLEDALAAFTGSILTQMDRAKEDFEMGPMYVMHLAGRDRQVFVTPLAANFALVAVVDAGASAPTVTLHMLAVSREILELIHAEVDVKEESDDR